MKKLEHRSLSRKIQKTRDKVLEFLKMYQLKIVYKKTSLNIFSRI